MDADSITPDFSIEEAALKSGLNHIAGVDEAGRGPWAGPVVAAAVVLDPGNIPDGLNDSKKLTERRRDHLFEEILATADVGVGIIDVDHIDEVNILNATMAAMTKALTALATSPGHALIDGNRCPQLACSATAVVQGDSISLSIAAASIVAKVKRDAIMRDAASKFPGYGFERHKGYGTAQHREALKILGPCPIHRQSFAPIRSLILASR